MNSPWMPVPRWLGVLLLAHLLLGGLPACRRTDSSRPPADTTEVADQWSDGPVEPAPSDALSIANETAADEIAADPVEALAEVGTDCPADLPDVAPEELVCDLLCDETGSGDDLSEEDLPELDAEPEDTHNADSLPCIPDCSPGKNCGPDGCGGSCGTCFNPCNGEEDVPDLCWEGTCFTPCCADCEGKECGDNGCGAPCGGCDDLLSCTEDECQDFQCVHTLAAGYCAIGGSCLLDDEANPDNPCLCCDSNQPWSWTALADGTACGLTAFCHSGNCCDPVTNCQGRECGPDGCGGNCGDCAQGTCADGYGICVEEGWVTVPAGTYVMGSTDEESCLQVSELPAHAVTISHALLVSTHEVTQEQWSATTGADNPSYYGQQGGSPSCTQSACPVESINWYEALAYANQLSAQAELEPCYSLVQCSGTLGAGCPEGDYWCDGDYTCAEVGFAGFDCAGYRLPTEAEWEYLARGGTSKAFAWPLPDGGDKNDDCECGQETNLLPSGWYCANGDLHTHPTGEKEANGFGLYDMAGNVLEWCWDGLYPYVIETEEGPVVDPVGEGQQWRAVRGGSFHDPAYRCRSASRDFDERSSRFLNIGFRLVRSLPPPLPAAQ